MHLAGQDRDAVTGASSARAAADSLDWPRRGESRRGSRVTQTTVQRLAVVGTGLMGASVGLAAKRGPVEVVGYDLDRNALDRAFERRAIDTAAADLESAVADADLVVVATPVGSIPRLVSASLAATGPACTVTDVGSTKGAICAALAPERRFVGGHPLCGAETRGPAAARPDMFEGAIWLLTPLDTTDPARHRLVERFVASLGARPVSIDPGLHDRVVAVTSHVPHVLANLLLEQASSTVTAGPDPLELGGGALRDLARIAGANPSVWREIFLENADELAAALAAYRRRIEHFERALRERDASRVEASIEAAAEHRSRVRGVGEGASAPRTER